MSRRPPLLILGMHRSGTSALTRAMNICGWRLAERIMPPNPANPTGYWEPIEVARFNDRLLREIGHHWADPAPLPAGWSERPEIVAMQEEAAEILRTDYPALDGIVLKDPRLSRLLPFWERIFEGCGVEPVCLIMSRHPVEVAQSLARRENMGRRHALLLWLAYMLDADASSRDHARAIVEYDALLADWRTSLEPAVAAIWPEGDTGLDAGTAKLEAFLDPEQRHFADAEEDLSAARPLDGAVRRARDWFAQGGGEPAEIEDVRKEWRRSWARPDAEADRRAMMEALPCMHFEVAAWLRAQGAPNEALQAIRKAVAAMPEAAHYHARRAEILADLGRHAEAIETFRRALAIGGPNPNQLRSLCEQYIAAGRGAEAVEAMRANIAAASNMPLIASRLATRLEEAGQAEPACAMLAVATEAAPGRHSFHEAHSKVLEKLGRLEEAVAAMQRAVAAGPDKPRYRKRLERLIAAQSG